MNNGPAPLAIIGIGNLMRRDDGVGHAAISELRSSDLGALHLRIDLITLDGESTRLIEAWRGRELVIVVDAARAQTPPGTIHRLVVGVDDLPAWAASASSHSAGLAEAIELAKVLDALPEELVVFGVEPGELSMGEGLTPEVEAALPALITLIIEETARSCV